MATDAYTGLLAKMATGVPDEGVPNKVASHVHFIWDTEWEIGSPNILEDSWTHRTTTNNVGALRLNASFSKYRLMVLLMVECPPLHISWMQNIHEKKNRHVKFLTHIRLIYFPLKHWKITFIQLNYSISFQKQCNYLIINRPSSPQILLDFYLLVKKLQILNR